MGSHCCCRTWVRTIEVFAVSNEHAFAVLVSHWMAPKGTCKDPGHLSVRIHEITAGFQVTGEGKHTSGVDNTRLKVHINAPNWRISACPFT